MGSVLRMMKTLEIRPSCVRTPGIRIRDFAESDPHRDCETWLALRSLALPTPDGGRPWTAKNFDREFLTRDWWSSDRMLFAEFEVPSAESEPIGVVAYGDTRQADEATIQWLMVAPQHRRQCVASTLLCELELRCWNANRRYILLETLSAWKPAVEFYRAHGFRER